MREPFRIPPNLPARAYQTFAISSPRDTTVKVACEQAGCLAWRYGWELSFDQSITCGEPAPMECRWIPLGQPLCGRCAALYIRVHSGRTFKESRRGDGKTVFRFEPRQRCFDDHRTRPERYFVRGGDWRPEGRTPVRQHSRPIDWVEDMAEQLDAVNTDRQRG